PGARSMETLVGREGWLPARYRPLLSHGCRRSTISRHVVERRLTMGRSRRTSRHTHGCWTILAIALAAVCLATAPAAFAKPVDVKSDRAALGAYKKLLDHLAPAHAHQTVERNRSHLEIKIIQFTAERPRRGTPLKGQRYVLRKRERRLSQEQPAALTRRAGALQQPAGPGQPPITHRTLSPKHATV